MNHKKSTRGNNFKTNHNSCRQNKKKDTAINTNCHLEGTISSGHILIDKTTVMKIYELEGTISGK